MADRVVPGTVALRSKDFLERCREGEAGKPEGLEQTLYVVRQLERGNTILDVYIEDIVILFAFVQLFPARANRVDDLANLLPT